MKSLGKDGLREDAAEAAAAEQAPKEPEEAPSFFGRKIAQAEQWLREHDIRRLSKDLLEKERLARLHRLVKRGEETRRFLDSDFWKDHLRPELESSETVKPWRPGDRRTLEEVAVDHLFASGESRRSELILEKFQQWIREGDEAKKIIAADVERRKNIREIRGASA